MDPSHVKILGTAEIERLVSEILSKAYSSSIDIPIDIDLLVQKQSFVDDIIPAEELEDKLGGAATLVYKEQIGSFDILVDEDTYNKKYGRASFSIAHEVGHIVMHGAACKGCNSPEKAIEFSHRLKDRYSSIEGNANSFAAALLMPYSTVRSHADTLYEGLVRMYSFDYELIPHKVCSNLANQYEVNIRPMEIRLRELGVIKAIQNSLRSGLHYLDL